MELKTQLQKVVVPVAAKSLADQQHLGESQQTRLPNTMKLDSNHKVRINDLCSRCYVLMLMELTDVNKT